MVAATAESVSRPIGALIFGHMGDRFSRKTMLAAALITAGLVSFAFAAWGWRLPFVVGGVLTAIALVLILRVEKIAGQTEGLYAERRPTLRQLFVKFPKPLFIGFAAQRGLSAAWRDAAISPKGVWARRIAAKVLAATSIDLAHDPALLARATAEQRAAVAS